MNIYRLSQTVNQDYDSFDCCIVAAPDVETAQDMKPIESWLWDDHLVRDAWAPRQDVTVEFLGVALDWVGQGVLLASYRPG